MSRLTRRTTTGSTSNSNNGTGLSAWCLGHDQDPDSPHGCPGGFTTFVCRCACHTGTKADDDTAAEED